MAILTPTQRDRILPRMIEDEMRESFIDYSMSVIVQRALPDVRDGLKPVHRRILFAMHEAGLIPARPYKKCATVVGDVLGKYHPHGDASVYDALVRMVQDFSLRYPLVDGQGNFGSIDGDAAAAYRYTESRLSALATEMLADIDRDTVDFAPNYDDRLTEPRVLPARVPNLLVNGSSGIAVGMSTNVPPHNLGEVVRAAVHLLDHPECTLDDLMVHLPGPDFPTGGLIMGTKGIRDAYATGRGRVVMQARMYKESRRNGKDQIVITEIPYGTNKSRILEQIAELARGGKLADVADLRDESDRDGIRIVVELKRGADPYKVVAGLYKWTALQTTFGVIALALDKGVPREFSLKEILERFRDHRIQVVVRRSRWELQKAQDEAHVLEGLQIALRRIDEVIAIIRGSRNRETAARKLEKELKLTERQSEAILSMRLSRLTQLETRELRDRLAELARRIGELQALLASPEQQVRVIRDELLQLAVTYGDPRRTTLIENEKGVRLEDMLAAEEVVVTVTREGFVKQIPMPVYQRAAGTGRGLIGTEYEADYLERVLVASTEDTLLVFTTDGRAYAYDVRDLPEPELRARGKRLHQLLELGRNVEIAAIHRVRDFVAERTALFATQGGSVKRTTLDQFGKIRAGGIEAISLRAGDRLVGVALTDGEMDVVLAGSGGRAIRFGEADVPLMGRATQGVRGMKLDAKERLAGMAAGRPDTAMVAVTARGQGKRFAIDELPLQKRDGKGTVITPTGKEFGELVAMLPLATDLNAVLTSGESRRIRRDGVPPLGRDAAPEPVLELARSERIALVTPLAERDATAPPAGPDDDPTGDDGGPSGNGGSPTGGPTTDGSGDDIGLFAASAENGDGSVDEERSADGEGSGDGDRPVDADVSGDGRRSADRDASGDGDRPVDAIDAGDAEPPVLTLTPEDASAADGAAPAPPPAPELFAGPAVADEDGDDAIIEDRVEDPPRRRARGTRAHPTVADVGPKATREPEPAPAPAPPPAPAPTPAPRRTRGSAPTAPPAPAPEPAPRRGKAPRLDQSAAEAPAVESEAPTPAKRGRKATPEAPLPEPPEPTPEPKPKTRAARATAPEPAPAADPPAPPAPRRGKKPMPEPDPEPGPPAGKRGPKSSAAELDLFG